MTTQQAKCGRQSPRTATKMDNAVVQKLSPVTTMRSMFAVVCRVVGVKQLFSFEG
jgi:hypothetical protein